ncbi:MAG: HupE/UreJ family protein [Flavobacteriales bacterium]|nr:HupE/UreJ family protein [Flavobacteriales bacterium]
MASFADTFVEGFYHITDLQGADHIVFLLALCSGFGWSSWKKVLMLVTAFTIGHAITLILAGLDLVRVSSSWIEFLIPVTILITAFGNLIRKNNHQLGPLYPVALLFGLIHGLGFSNYFRIISNDSDLVVDLLAFNLGVEAGQIPIVLGVMLLGWLVCRFFAYSERDWQRLVSGIAIGAALMLIVDTWPGL